MHIEGQRTVEGLPRVFNASELTQASQPRWLAKGRLPRAAASILVGEEGIGKSLLWVYLAAAITTGSALPEFGIPKRQPESVLIVATEDDWSTTVLPRLQVAGADLRNIKVICTDEDGSGPPVFPRDLDLVESVVPAPALVVVDAWMDTVPSGLDVQKPQGASKALSPWKDVATRTDSSILLLTHTNRSSTGNARDKYGATSELRKKARLTLFAQTDENGDLTVGPEKANTTGSLRASVFRIDPIQHFPATDDHDGTIPKLVFVEESSRTAREILADMADQGSKPTDGGQSASEWLKVFMSENGGRCRSTDVKAAAAKAGFSDSKTNRAKAEIGLNAIRESGVWWWESNIATSQDGIAEGSTSLRKVGAWIGSGEPVLVNV
ncbi:AAA family ATPase [Rhodococcus erythropolis]|uniref:AAA family ATPase n=1 Tax=Rhodococcus erythropolis TaxID=1833 RepID=UPI00381605F1